ncbi:MAG: NAD(P)-dependent oxidoreductase [Hyphomicrobiaceae bacterium]|nr:MAG: NAD(P)-dependent oxidoreductase [Hyphomicrobiaceae bacterium]
MAKPVVGLIGLGLMGAGFARRLIATGHQVIGFDVMNEKVDAAVKLGAAAASSPTDVARQSDIVLTSLTATKNLEEVIEGKDGIAGTGRLDGKILVDHSTADIDTTKRLAAVLADKTGMAFIDAPVSGGPGAAETGTLAIMAGGSADAIGKSLPVLLHLGRVTRMGGIGAGQATKLVNQALVLTNYCVIAEALRIAEAYGIDAAKVPEALAQGHAGSNLLPVLFQRMIARDFAPRGYARQVLKDLEMLNDAAKSKHLPLPMAGQALTLFRLLNAQGKSELDGSAVLTLWPDAN